MGRLFVIGIATRMLADKEKCGKAFKDVEGLKAAMEKQFNSNGNHKMIETESKVILELKPEVAVDEWVSFVQGFLPFGTIAMKNKMLFLKSCRGKTI